MKILILNVNNAMINVLAVNLALIIVFSVV